MKIVVDFNEFEDLTQFHDFIVEKLDLDENYNRNLDALHSVKENTDAEFEVIKGGKVLLEMQELIENILV